jgi:tripartite-type tricarboxylate transporter receptor subunit TctC
MNLLRSLMLAVVAGFFVSLAPARTGPIRILIGFPPGASGDAIGRKIAERMQTELGEPVIVDNRPGAGGRIALDLLRTAKADGRTLIFTPSTPLTAAPWLYNVDYDPMKDFEPVAHVARFEYVFVVGPGVKAKSLADFIRLARADRTVGFYSASAPGGGAHMALDTFARVQRLPLTYVGYRGTANALTDLLGGHLPAFIGNVADLVDFINHGKVSALGLTGIRRARQLPQVPTFKEQGFDIEADGWFAIYAPAKTPRRVLARMSKAVVDAVRDPNVKGLGDSVGLEMTGWGPDELAAIQKRDYEQARTSIKISGFKPEQ